jgi:hypothetical protein
LKKLLFAVAALALFATPLAFANQAGGNDCGQFNGAYLNNRLSTTPLRVVTIQQLRDTPGTMGDNAISCK